LATASSAVAKRIELLVRLTVVDETRLDQEAFVLALRAGLVGSLVLFCGDRGVGEELAQDALARALERWGQVGKLASRETWTYRTGFNLARSWARRRSAERRAYARLAVDTPVLPDTATAVAVRLAIATLPVRQRAALVARYYADLSIDESAEVLGCAPGTVKALVHQGIEGLRRSGLVDVLDREEVNTDATTD